MQSFEQAGRHVVPAQGFVGLAVLPRQADSAQNSFRSRKYSQIFLPAGSGRLVGVPFSQVKPAVSQLQLSRLQEFYRVGLVKWFNQPVVL